MNKNNKLWGMIGLAGLALFFAGLLISMAQPVTGGPAYILLFLGGAGILSYSVVNFRTILAAFGSRQAKAGLRTSAVLFLVTSVLVLVYILLNSMNFLRIDMTANKRFSNSSMTRQVVASVKEDVTFHIFTQKVPENVPEQAAQVYMMMDSHARNLEFMLKNYSRQNSRIRVKMIDMDEQPLMVKQYNIKSPGTVIVVAGKKTRTIHYDDYAKTRIIGRRPTQVVVYEEALTRALAEMTRKRTFKVYFTTGHRELDVNKSDNAGATYAKAALEDDGMTVHVTNLLTARRVPADCDLLVIAGPRDTIDKKEIEAIEAYMMEGRPVIFLAERESPASYGQLLSRWGVNLLPYTVMEPVNFVQAPFLFVPYYSDTHPIMKPLIDDNARSLVFTAAVLEQSPAAKAKDGPFRMETLIVSSKDAWAERDNLETAKVMPTFTAGEKKGDLILAYAVTRRAQQTKTQKGKTVVTEKGPAKPLRYVVVSDSDLIGNSIFTRQPGNRMFLLNAAKWAMGREQTISIPPREAVNKPLQLTEGDYRLIFIVSVVLMPLAIVILGLIVYIRRRVNG